MNYRKKIFFTFLVCGYLLCLYAAISGRFPFLNQYSEGDYKGNGSGYLWEVLGSILCLFMLPCIPDKYYVKYKNSKIFTFILIAPVLVLWLISLWETYF